MQRFGLYAGVLCSLALISSCEGAPAFPPVRNITRVVVRANSRDTLAIITDSARLRAIETFINARLDGWQRPVSGTPIASVMASLYTDQFERGFGLGQGFLEQYRDAGSWASRTIAATDADTFALLFSTTLKPPVDKQR